MARLGIGLATFLSDKGRYLYSRPIAPAPRVAWPPGAMGPRRLPPSPPSHPAARLNKDNSILSLQKSVHLSRSLLSRPRARRGSARAR